MNRAQLENVSQEKLDYCRIDIRFTLKQFPFYLAVVEQQGVFRP